MATDLRDTIVPADYPALRLLAWNRDPTRPIAAEEAFALYERGWRHVDKASLSAEEQALVDELTRRFGGGQFLGR